MHRNSLLSLSFLILFTLSTKSSFAQYPGMGAFRASQSRQFMNQQMRTQMQMQRMHGVEATAQEYLFEVMMLDSTKKEISSAIYTDIKTKKRFLLSVAKRYKNSDTNRYKKIYPSQTLYIAVQVETTGNGGDENTTGKYLYGRAADSCWMFNIKGGAINIYSYSCEGWDSRYSPATIVGIQLNDGAIEQFTAENLKKIIGQDAEAMKVFDKKK
jgi:hypothetical protein